MLIKLSYSEIDTLGRCPRRHQLKYEERLESKKISLGKEFGDVLHKGLGMLYNTGDLTSAIQTAVDVWKKFDGMDTEGFRNNSKIKEVMTAYYDQLFKDEGWEDQGGEELGVLVLTRGELTVEYRYKWDRKGLSGGIPAVQEWKFLKYPGFFVTEPNNQVVGYLRASGARKGIVTLAGVGYKTSKNGVVKEGKDGEKSIFQRDIIFYDDWVFDEWERDVFGWAESILTYRESNYWPKNAPGACGDFGGCEFKQICASEPEARKLLIDMGFRRREEKR